MDTDRQKIRVRYELKSANKPNTMKRISFMWLSATLMISPAKGLRRKRARFLEMFITFPGDNFFC